MPDPTLCVDVRVVHQAEKSRLYIEKNTDPEKNSGRSSVKVEVIAVLSNSSLISRFGLCGRKATLEEEACSD